MTIGRLLLRVATVWVIASLCTLCVVSVVLASMETRDVRRAASRRVDGLQVELRRVNEQMATASGDIADLRARTEALSEQIRQLGGTPVVVVQAPPTTPPTTVRTQVPTTQPQPAPTTATTQPPATTTTVARRCVLAPLNPTC